MEEQGQEAQSVLKLLINTTCETVASEVTALHLG